jgi:hypothetical protein
MTTRIQQLRPRIIRKTSALAALALTLGAVAVLADDQRPTPGRYEVTTRSEFGNLPVPPTTVTTSSCLTQQDLDQDPQKVFADLPASDRCTIDEFTMEGGKLTMSLACDTDEGRMVMSTEGAYSPTTYSMQSVINIDAGGTKITTTATVEAVRSGDC